MKIRPKNVTGEIHLEVYKKLLLKIKKSKKFFQLTNFELNGRDVKCNFFIADNEANGLSIRELGLFCSDGIMFSHRVRRDKSTGEVGVIEKFSDIELKGFWILHF